VAFGTSGTKRREPAEPGEMSQGSPEQSGTRGPKVREPAEPAEMRTFVPEQLGQKGANRPNRGNLSQTVRNQMGHMSCEYANRPVRPKWEISAPKPNGKKGRAG
ncbi:hypothetical protein KI387_015865, partial [Taxus chinensis]